MVWGALLIAALIVPAHSWYPSECCSDKDCAIVQGWRVQVTSSGGYVLDSRWNIAASVAKVSPDENYHACIRNGQVVCFFAPRGTV